MSCAELRHLFWQLILLVARSAEAVLGWSRWRRRHQAEARWHHYRRRVLPGPVVPTGPAPSPSAREAAATLTPPAGIELAWQRLQALLPPSPKRRPIIHPRRTMLEAIVYVLQTGCGWGRLPTNFPPARAVHTQFRRWKRDGIWSQIWEGLNPPFPV